MEINDTLIIADEFTDTPGARSREDGEFSGQEFLEDFLLPRFEKAVEGQYILQIDLDRVWGYPSSFVSGSFGKLSMEKGAELVLNHINLKSESNQLRIEKIEEEIKNPQQK